MSAHLDIDDVAAQSPIAKTFDPALNKNVNEMTMDELGDTVGTLRGEIIRRSFRENELRMENERLRDWIAEEGKRTDTCTKNVLMRVCEDCRCGKLKPPNTRVTGAPEGEA